MLEAVGLAFAALLVAPASAAVGRILHFSDVHLNISASFSAADNARIPIRYFADAPLPLLESALVFAKEHVVEEPELFLYTGTTRRTGSSRMNILPRRWRRTFTLWRIITRRRESTATCWRPPPSLATQTGVRSATIVIIDMY